MAARVTRWLLLMVVLLSAPVSAGPEWVAVSDLGDLELTFAQVTATDQIPGAPLRGEVRARGGEAVRVLLPRTAHRVVFLVSPGALVQAGEAVVRLEGPEIHHWQLEFDAVADRFAMAKARYSRNEPLYRSGALAADRWAAIQDSYLELSLEYEHMRHFGELLLPASADLPDALVVAAPEVGRVQFDSRAPAQSEAETLFTVIPTDALRLHVEVPVGRAANLRALRLHRCQLAVTAVDQQARGFFVAAWSAPVPDACGLLPGAVVTAEPTYATQALLVPRAALFQWQRDSHVLIRDEGRLMPRRVELLADTATGYAIAADPELVDADVLVTSVGAVQGLLMGLGGE